ncbi:MAG: indole-3-glycerol phosphate synthase TrpC [Candidatus Schekmanbacteria bacterium]|nr:indole-3-glycerol phosphate synthase TrpC [Candidatus Schekmanbacteria bacterium]
MMGILDTIISYKKEELAETKRKMPLTKLQAQLTEVKPGKDFIGALKQERLQVIAEIKPASPSKGVLRPDCNPVEIAEIYRKNGAAALSVLTERRFFQGSLENLVKVREKVNLPLLRKDFIINPYQVYEAKAAGADAILLIVACLGKEQMQELSGLAAESGLAVLPEVHSYAELDKLLLWLNPPLIGINNRNLQTMETTIDTTLSMLADIPPDKVVVSESGIKDKKDAVCLAKAGVSAILVGETLMTAQDMGAKLRELLE